MMIVTAKLRWKKILLFLAAAVAALVAVLLLAGRADTAISTFGSKNAKDDASRVAYLSDLGWQVDPTPVSQEDVWIPDQLEEEIYGAYLTLQEHAGFDLAAYAGKTVTRYTYQVLNYPTGETDVVAGLLVYKGCVVGGDVMSTALDGFIQSLVYPAG